VEAVDVASGVVNVVVVLDRVGAAVRKGDECVAGYVGECRAETAQQVGSGSVLKVVFEAEKICEGTGARSLEGTYGD